MSVVVPVRNAAAAIEPCVNALLAQDYPSDLYRVIVVDNGSSDGTLAKLAACSPAVEVLFEPKRGPAAARNRGIRAARTPLIAFTDADCVPDPDWLRRLVACAERAPEACLIGGPIVPLDPPTDVARFAAWLLDQESAIGHQHAPYVITANLLARRDLLVRLDGFDEGMLRGQDVDLSYRARRQLGCAFVYAPGAVVRHRNVETVSALFRKGLQHGLAVSNILGRHAVYVGETRVSRLVKPGIYRRILVDLSRGLPLLWGRSRDDARRFALYRSVFNLSKQIGLLSAMVAPTLSLTRAGHEVRRGGPRRRRAATRRRV